MVQPPNVTEAGLALLFRGTVVYKHCGGTCHLRRFKLSEDSANLIWLPCSRFHSPLLRRQRSCRIDDAAAVRVGQASPIHALYPHRLCLSLLLKPAYASAEMEGGRPRRKRLDLSFVDKEAFERWTAALSHLVATRQQVLSSGAPLLGSRIRELRTGASCIVEAFDAARCCYCVHMDVTGELKAMDARELGPLYCNSYSEPRLITPFEGTPVLIPAVEVASPMNTSLGSITSSGRREEDELVEEGCKKAAGSAVEDGSLDILFHTLPPPAAGDLLAASLTLSALPQELGTAPVLPCPFTGMAGATLDYFNALPSDMEAYDALADNSTEGIPEEIDDELTDEPVEVVQLPTATGEGMQQLPCEPANSTTLLQTPALLSTTLRTLIEGLRLGPGATESALHSATLWCDQQGFEDSSELLEVGAEEELVAALGLKPGKARLLVKRLAEKRTRMARPPMALRLGGDVQLPCEETIPMGLPVCPAPRSDLQGIDWPGLVQAYERAEALMEARAAP